MLTCCEGSHVFYLSPVLQKPRVVKVVAVPCSCHPCTKEVKAGGSEAQGPPRFHSKFESSLSFMRSYLKGNRNYFKSRITIYKLYSCHSITRSITGRVSFFPKSVINVFHLHNFNYTWHLSTLYGFCCCCCSFFSSPISCQCLEKKN